jgi:tRNA (guanine37-N1)-methyltransferase
MLFLKVPRKEAEAVRQKLMRGGIFSPEYGIIRDGAHVLLPVTGPYGGFELVERDGERRPKRHERLKDALSGFLGPEELSSVIGSFDIIGDIAIMEIPEGLEPKEKLIGTALLGVHRNLRTVLKKLGPMEGEYRVRKLACIAGPERTETTYRESGLSMKLDAAKVYFSVRLAHERKRIAGLAGAGERVLVLFAGVGPFALAIAKKRPDSRVVAVELNPDAVDYMEENIVLNRLDNVEPVEADARTWIFTDNSFDRVVMPLPKSAHEFLDVAFRAVKDGGVVHLYAIADIRRPFEDAMGKAEAEAEKSGVGLERLSERMVRPYSPTAVQVVLDLRVSKALNRARAGTL